jgi:hypothetical protein
MVGTCIVAYLRTHTRWGLWTAGVGSTLLGDALRTRGRLGDRAAPLLDPKVPLADLSHNSVAHHD